MAYFSFQGMRLHYIDQGAGPLVILLPGNTASAAHLLGDMERLTGRFRVVALDLPGTGMSDRMAVWPTDWWGLGAQAAAALIAHLDAGPAIAIGSSGGGVIALLLALAAPERVRAVVADSCVDRRDPAAWHAVADGRAERLPGQIAFWEHGHGADWAQVVDADTDVIRRFADAGGDWFGDRLAAIRCPVLLTGSLTDSLLPEMAERQVAMARQIPGCRVYLANAGDHPLMWSAPEAFYSALDAFLAAL